VVTSLAIDLMAVIRVLILCAPDHKLGFVRSTKLTI
jgi:hypothetical protein